MRIEIIKVLTYIFSIFLMPLLQGCKEKNHSTELLQQARLEAEENPSEALRLLNSISDPETMDKNNYMLYIVVKVQAKYRAKQNIVSDTLIFEAQKYFDSKNNSALSALANLYAASVYYENNLSYKDLEHSRLSLFYAKDAENNLLMAKSSNIIGNIYNDKNMLDSAIVYYKQALTYYDKVKNTEEYNLEVRKALGMVYRKMGDIENAYNSFNDGYIISKSLNNSQYKVTFEHMLGTIYNDKKDYIKAEKYLHLALNQTLNPKEHKRIYLSLLMLYNNKNQLDSADYYANLLKESLPEITYPYTLQESYNSLSDYYQKRGDYKEASYYASLQKDIDLKINEANNSKLLVEAEQKYKDTLKKKEAENLHVRNQLLWVCAILVILLISAIVYFKIKYFRQKEAEQRKLLEVELEGQKAEMDAKEKIWEQQSKSIEYLHNIYGNIITNWGEIDKKVQALAKEYGTTEEPELYLEIKNVMENFKHDTNQYLIELAKDYLREKPYGKDALSVLDDKKILLFMLYYKEYKRNEVSILLGVKPHKHNMLLRKLELKNKLVKVGMPEEEISQILFTEDN
ncbi:hypothetical protein JGH11_02295 [Dysgonomonas sp. Marseille-P4677]|uniref:tetratricopeptide repeat protein n=1 Tax=Dysgonomonas sp. Marseille-P4677 TaxID=2364790 RepID=UPI001914498F|nr:hypothetical protein [Dysgonomonas sp. Marseille-P4677]MBK5719696.1 hypothetical protein [Dysgonomonas sp. Marseille-P4677]